MKKKNNILSHIAMRKKIANRARMKSCIIGTTGFLIVMHILMNTDEYFGWFPTAG